jgi:predicted transcriptional regulator
MMKIKKTRFMTLLNRLASKQATAAATTERDHRFDDNHRYLNEEDEVFSFQLSFVGRMRSISLSN